ncbi:hypothetical protein MVEG_09028 [Podila verticillata NRRL 6337]|nr:hypothetical protein MVEG_09028 [Podila verticillata NRRL 6337]
MTTNQTSPLEIPELVYRISWFLPLWELESVGIYSFLPYDLAACIQVNRLWNRTLTPLLWMAFETYIADELKIPKYVIQKHSHHLRYANFNCNLALPTIHTSRLRELEVDNMEPLAIRELTRSNPQLEFLDINMAMEITVLSLQSILEPLINLSQLELRLGQYVSLDQIVVPLAHLTKLRQLNLAHFTEMEQLDMLPLQLNSVTVLVLNCAWNRNPGLHQIVRLFPNIESLKIHAKSIDAGAPLELPCADLSRNLRENCPKLKSIQNMQLTEFDWTAMSEDDHLKLLTSTDRLAHYNLPTTVFSFAICDALLAHASTLETVDIYCKAANEETFREAGRVLSLCPQLLSFKICTRYRSTLGAESLALFDYPWNCPHLKELHLHWFEPLNFTMSNMSHAQYLLDQLDEISRTPKWTRILGENPLPIPELYEGLLRGQGWNILQRELFHKSQLEKILYEKVFERVLTMPGMRKVRLGEYFFLKRGYTV